MRSVLGLICDGFGDVLGEWVFGIWFMEIGYFIIICRLYFEWMMGFGDGVIIIIIMMIIMIIITMILIKLINMYSNPRQQRCPASSGIFCQLNRFNDNFCQFVR